MMLTWPSPLPTSFSMSAARPWPAKLNAATKAVQDFRNDFIRILPLKRSCSLAGSLVPSSTCSQFRAFANPFIRNAVSEFPIGSEGSRRAQFTFCRRRLRPLNGWCELQKVNCPLCPRSDRVLPEQLGDQCGVEIGAHLDDRLVPETHDPAIVIVEAHAVLSRGLREQLDYRDVA